MMVVVTMMIMTMMTMVVMMIMIMSTMILEKGSQRVRLGVGCSTGEV